MFVALKPGRAEAVARCRAKVRNVADCMAAPKGQARPLASATAGSDTGGIARKRAPSALLRPRNAEQRPTNGWRRFPLGIGTRPALRSRAQPPKEGERNDHEHRHRQHPTMAASSPMSVQAQPAAAVTTSIQVPKAIIPAEIKNESTVSMIGAARMTAIATALGVTIT